MVIGAQQSGRPAAGQLLRCERLGSEAVYRVVGYDGELVELEVVTGPGIRAGQRFRFTAAAVAAMQPTEQRVVAPD